MKTLFKILIGILVLSSLSACELMKTLVEPSMIKVINVPNDKISFDELEDSFIVKFSSTTSWRVTSDSDWCKVSPSEGSESETQFTVTVDRNTVPEDRRAVVILSTSDSESRSIFNVVQTQMTLLSADGADYELPDEGGTFEVTMQHNVKYTVNIPADVRWIQKKSTKAISTTTHVFTVDANPEEVSRTAVITFMDTSREWTETVKVFQHGLPPKRNLIMKVKHLNDVFYLPQFNEGLTGTIYWGMDGKSDPFGSGIGYNYGQSGGEKEITFDLTGYHNKFTAEFQDIKGIVEIDLSGL